MIDIWVAAGGGGGDERARRPESYLKATKGDPSDHEDGTAQALRK